MYGKLVIMKAFLNNCIIISREAQTSLAICGSCYKFSYNKNYYKTRSILLGALKYCVNKYIYSINIV